MSAEGSCEVGFGRSWSAWVYCTGTANRVISQWLALGVCSIIGSMSIQYFSFVKIQIYNTSLSQFKTRSQGLLSTSNSLRQITWLWDERTGGPLSGGDRSPHGSGLVPSFALYSEPQIDSDRANEGTGGGGLVPSWEQTPGPIIWSVFWASDWLRQITWVSTSMRRPVHSRNFTAFVTFDINSSSEFSQMC